MASKLTIKGVIKSIRDMGLAAKWKPEWSELVIDYKPTDKRWRKDEMRATYCTINIDGGRASQDDLEWALREANNLRVWQTSEDFLHSIRVPQQA